MNISKEDMDTSWITDYERMIETKENLIREPMTSISTHFIYIDTQNAIRSVTSSKYTLTEPNKIPTNQVLEIVQQNKQYNNIPYSLMEILLFHVDLDGEHIQNFVKNENPEQSKSFFKVLPIVGDILIPPSIFTFHKINCIYFLLKENPAKNPSLIKSILKNQENGGTSVVLGAKKTKKVRINLENLNTKQTKCNRQKL